MEYDYQSCHLERIYDQSDSLLVGTVSAHAYTVPAFLRIDSAQENADFLDLNCQDVEPSDPAEPFFASLGDTAAQVCGYIDLEPLTFARKESHTTYIQEPQQHLPSSFDTPSGTCNEVDQGSMSRALEMSPNGTNDTGSTISDHSKSITKVQKTATVELVKPSAKEVQTNTKNVLKTHHIGANNYILDNFSSETWRSLCLRQGVSHSKVLKLANFCKFNQVKFSFEVISDLWAGENIKLDRGSFKSAVPDFGKDLQKVGLLYSMGVRAYFKRVAPQKSFLNKAKRGKAALVAVFRGLHQSVDQQVPRMCHEVLISNVNELAE